MEYPFSWVSARADLIARGHLPVHKQISPTPLQRWLIAVVVVGALLVAGIAFAGSYTAVHRVAEAKGFGAFSIVFPIGIDFGILVVLALDVLLTWLRCPFPLLRYTAWLLTGATIAFNAALLWPDPLGTAMHAVLPVIFTVSVEAARHAVGRLADITDARHIESIRLARWLLSPIPTFKLWRGMQLWNRRSLEMALKEEQDRLVYIAKLKRRHGYWWRFKAPVEELLPLRLAALGKPLPHTGKSVKSETGPLAALQRPARPPTFGRVPVMAGPGQPVSMWLDDTGFPRRRLDDPPLEASPTSDHLTAHTPKVSEQVETPFQSAKETVDPPPARLHAGVTSLKPVPEVEPERRSKEGRESEQGKSGPRVEAEPTPMPIPVAESPSEPSPEPERRSGARPEPEVPRGSGIIAGTGATRAEALYAVFAGLTDRTGKYPSMPQLSKFLFEEHGITGQKGRPMSAESLRRYRKDWVARYERETQGTRAALPG